MLHSWLFCNTLNSKNNSKHKFRMVTWSPVYITQVISIGICICTNITDLLVHLFCRLCFFWDHDCIFECLLEAFLISSFVYSSTSSASCKLVISKNLLMVDNSSLGYQIMHSFFPIYWLFMIFLQFPIFKLTLTDS